ncbi:MAG TPA: hypothetical protein VD966_09115, partial [Pyrinomonadaceae bacterium]|nr:hypothetical protein [Pyrinomonadaceae bacterium]
MMRETPKYSEIINRTDERQREVPLVDLWGGAEQESSEVSGILAEAIEDWLQNVTAQDEPPEVVEARELARRYRYRYVDLLPSNGESPISTELLNELPIDLMLRYQFVPLRREG